MYNIIKQKEVRLANIRTDALLNVHIVIDYNNISITELLACIAESITVSKSIHTYIYGLADSRWFKHLDDIMKSVLISYSNVTLVELNVYNDSIELVEYIDAVAGVKNSIYTSVLYLKHIGLTMLGKNDFNYITNKYTEEVRLDCIIEPNEEDILKFCKHKYYRTMYTELLNTLSLDAKKYRPNLSIKMLYIDQLGKEPMEIMHINKIIPMNKNILSSYNNIIPTIVDTTSIFTTSSAVELMIKLDNKDKSSDTIYIVLDTIDRTSCVNPNNNSYYIPIDSYITPGIINNIFDIILKNIYKES